MKETLNRYRQWRRRRDESQAARWAKKRQKGKSHFVSGFALFWCLQMTVTFTLVKYLFGESNNIAAVTVHLVLFFLGGLIVGFTAWTTNERKYFKPRPAAEETYNLTGSES